MPRTRKRPGITPVEQQERPPNQASAARPIQRAITGPGAADFIAAPGGLDVPESGSKGMAQSRDRGPLLEGDEPLAPRLGPDTEAFPGERQPTESMSGSATGSTGGGGLESHNPSPVRATGSKEKKDGA